jgi:hypothetical protein
MENKPIYSNQKSYLNASNSSQMNFLKKVPELARPPSVPVLGRKLSNESIITIRDESVSKYPYAVQVPSKKPLKHKLHSKLFQKIPKSLKKPSKTETNLKSRTPSPLTKVKSVKLVQSKQDPSKTSRTKRASMSSPHLTRPQKTPEKQNQVQIREIVEKSLKKQKKLKKSHEKLEKQKTEAKEKLKKNIKNLNLCTREENLKNFKQKMFNPRKPWGIEAKKKAKPKKDIYKSDLFSKPLKSVRKSKNMTPEVSPSKRCLSSRSNHFSSKIQKKKKKIPRSEKENLKIIEVIPSSDLFKRPEKKQKKTLKKCPEMKWLDDYLENLSEVSKAKSILSEKHSELPAFGIVDDFELFEQDSRFANELKLKNQENFSIPKLEEFSFEESGPSQDFFLEENSKIVRLKKINKQKNDEIQEKILQAKAKFEEKYLNEKLLKNFQSAAKGWISRKEFKELEKKSLLNRKKKIFDQSEEDSLVDCIITAKNNENFKKIEKQEDSQNLSMKISPKFEDESSWIFKRQSPEDPESILNDEEEVNTILKAFKIKTDKIRGINEKSQDLKAKHGQISLKPVSNPENSKTSSKKSSVFVSDSLPTEKSKINSRNPSTEDQKNEIIQMAPIKKGQNLNLNELSHRLLQEQQNLHLLEEESKEMLKIMTPESSSVPSHFNSLTLNNLSCDLSSEAEILRLFHEIIHKKYVNLDSVLEKNIRVLQEALADSLSSKSKTESLELKKKLQRISTEESTDDLDQLLKDLIGTQDIKSIEVEILQGFIQSFPGSRNSPVPPVSHHFPALIPAPINFEIPEFNLLPSQNLEEMLSQASSEKTNNEKKNIESNISLNSLESYLKQIENTLLSALILEALDDFFVVFSEDLLISLVETEVLLITQEFRQAFSDRSVFFFTHEIFSKFSDLISNELKDFKQDDPLELLSMMQESEIGSGHLPEVLFAVIDPKLFLEIISDDPLFVCIFKKMVFDCVNENLNKFISRLPTPWGTGKIERKNCEISFLFEKVAERMEKYTSFKMGKIFVPGEADFGIIQLREQKIVEVINYDNKELEEKWVDYEFEENQVKLDLADMVLEQLVEEGIEIAFY